MTAKAAASPSRKKASSIFKEAEAFWTPLRSTVAISAAKDLQSLADKVAVAAGSDLAQAGTLYATAGAQCKSCHDRHRTQMPDGTYRILP